MTWLIGFEMVMDGVLFFLASFGVFSERSRVRIRDGILALCFIVLCGVNRISIIADLNRSRLSIENKGFEILPVNDIYMFALLILILLIANSQWFRKNAIYSIFGTFAVFCVFIALRQVFILLFYGFGTSNGEWKPILCRLCSILLLCLLLYSPFFKWLREKLNDSLLPVKLFIANTSVMLFALVIFLDFDASRTADNMRVITGTITVLLIIDLMIGVYVQKHSAERKRIQMLEQYIPVIEELIIQVRARQHEFSNKLLAISAAVQTASDIEQAKAEIAGLIHEEQFDMSEKSLLACDSKITAGVIYSKMKNAEIRDITIVSEINTTLKDKVVRETEIVEIVGILVDNAVEASSAGDIIYIRLDNIDKQLSILVSNPHPPFSAADFVNMFRRGFSTKTATGGIHGHGLANAKDIVDRYRGKIITRNETIQGGNYVTMGVILP